MTNLNFKIENCNLFGEDSKKLAGQSRFEALIEPHIAIIVDAIESAFTTMHDDVDNKSPSYLNHLSKSVRMNEQIKGAIIDAFGDKVKNLGYNRFGLFLEGYVFLFKKLDRFGRPSNIRTKNSVMLMTQSKLNFPGTPEIIHVGYFTDTAWMELKQVRAVKIENEQVIWSSNLKALANQVTRVQRSTVIETDDADLVVAPKKGKDSKTG